MNQNMQDMTADELEAMARDLRAGVSGRPVVDVHLPDPSPVQVAVTDKAVDPYAVTSWGETEYDFVVPSGQRCRMRKLRPEEPIERDLLDRVTRLPGFAQEAIDKAEGKPPAMAEMPNREQMQGMIEILNELLPIVVVRPPVHRVPEPDGLGTIPERIPGVIYTDDIELADRLAIMERAIGGVKKMDNFREEPGISV